MSNASEPAYPLTEQEGEPGQRFGLTKREYFAAMAMQGYLANPSVDRDPATVAADSRVCADALLAELEKSQ